MRITINIDDDLLKKAEQLTGIREKTSLVRRGLESMIAIEIGRRLAHMGGTENNLKLAPRRRTAGR